MTALLSSTMSASAALSDVQVDVRSRATSVTARLTRQATTRFPKNSVQGIGMNAIATKALEVIMADPSIPQQDYETRAIKVMKNLLDDANMTYRDRQVETAVSEAAKKIASKGCCVIL